MKGYCHLSQIPLRAEARSASEMVSQLLYGETYEILKQEGEWFYVRMACDGYEGWISESSVKRGSLPGALHIQQELFDVLPALEGPVVTSMGSERMDAMVSEGEDPTQDIIELAHRFLGVPYLWGGRSFMGIDCSGFVQVVYKCLDIQLKRDASQQQKQGKAVRFDDIVPGDLIFFDSDHRVTHVGIAMGHGKIIHAHGQVRVDQLDKKGIFNRDKDAYTHPFHSARRVR